MTPDPRPLPWLEAIAVEGDYPPPCSHCRSTARVVIRGYPVCGVHDESRFAAADLVAAVDRVIRQPFLREARRRVDLSLAYVEELKQAALDNNRSVVQLVQAAAQYRETVRLCNDRDLYRALLPEGLLSARRYLLDRASTEQLYEVAYEAAGRHIADLERALTPAT